MTIIFLIFFFILKVQGYDDNEQTLNIDSILQNVEKQLISQKQVLNQTIKQKEIQLNKINQFSVQVGNYYFFYSQYDSNRKLNINLYSSSINFGFLYHIQNINYAQFESKQNKISNFTKAFISQKQITQKIRKNLQYKHFLKLSPKHQVINDKQIKVTKKLLFLIVWIPQTKFYSQNEQNLRKFDFNVIITQNTTILSCLKPIQYSLNKDQVQGFFLKGSECFDQKTQKNKEIISISEDLKKKASSQKKVISSNQQTEQTLLFHTLHLVGDFQYNISLIGHLKGSVQVKKVVQIETLLTQSTFQLNRSFLEWSHQQLKNDILSQIQSKQEIIFQSELQFRVRCISINCIFLTQVQKNSQVRQLIPGISYIYSINKQQIFQISNPYDLQIAIDMNKKNGFPQYQICSTKIKNYTESQCFKEFQNIFPPTHAFEVKQKDDKLHALGRNSQVIINSQHQDYCFQCFYFLALYTDYDNVLGIVTFKNSYSSVMIAEGNSITKVLKRNQTDSYLIYGVDSRLLFQKFSGKFQAELQQILLQDQYNFQKAKQSKKRKIKVNLNSTLLEQNYYSIDFKQCIENQDSQNGILTQTPKNHTDSLNKIYKLHIKTQNNYPSTYYSLIIVNHQTSKIILKDGIPFFNKQKNKVSIFKYLTQNLETQNFGTIIINSNQISEIQLQIYGNCLTLQQTEKSLSLKKIQEITFNNNYFQFLHRSVKKYEFQKIQNRKINLMANRIDIIIEPEMCKSYLIKMINNASQEKKSSITYEILVSFVDSMILPLNNEVPGILQYPGKIVQIYEIFIPEKSNLSIWINFCRSAKSRMQIYKNKQALMTQNSDLKVVFTSQSQLQQTVYLAHSGMFYIVIQFFGFSNILEYTILIKQHQVAEGFYYIDLSKQEQQISYSVKQGRFFSTTYQLYFSPIFLKHWSKDVQRDVEYFQTNYFILQSNSYPLLKRASNCKGQFFSDIVNHHEHFKQVKLEKQKLIFHPPKKQSDSEFSYAKYYERGFYSYQYETSNPLSFLIIVPVIAKQKNWSNSQKQITVIPYWKLDKKSRQPYQIIQLYNGRLYSIFQHWFISVVVWAQQIIDFHIYQSLIVTLILFISCLPITCCVLLCTYRTKVNIQFYCNKFYAYLEEKIKKSRQVQNQEAIIQSGQQNSIALPSEEGDNFSDGDIQIELQNEVQISSPLRPIRSKLSVQNNQRSNAKDLSEQSSQNCEIQEQDESFEKR